MLIKDNEIMKLKAELKKKLKPSLTIEIESSGVSEQDPEELNQGIKIEDNRVEIESEYYSEDQDEPQPG